MQHLQILNWNFFLLWPFSEGYPLMTYLWITSKVDYLCFSDGWHPLKWFVKWFKDLILTFAHKLQFFHYLWKDEFVSKDASLWNFYFVRKAIARLLHFLKSSKNGIYLKSKTPSFWLSIITFKKICFRSAKRFPLCNRLLNPLKLGYSLF